MIIGRVKPVHQLLEYIQPFTRLAVVACGTCMTVCNIGAREAALAVAGIRLAAAQTGTPAPDLVQVTVKRQCEPEYLEPLDEPAGPVEAILSFGCAVGAQALARRFPLPVLPAVDTLFIGGPEHNTWRERCIGCGDCDIHRTGGLCVLAACPKLMRNGPCGGEDDQGRCEADPAHRCIWLDVMDRWRLLGQEENARRFIPPKDWSNSRHGGRRRLERDPS